VPNITPLFRVLGLLCAIEAALPARAADFKIYYPDADKGDLELESRMFDTFDRNGDRSNERNLTAELGYGATDFWFVEVENEFTKAPQDRWQYEALGLENVFQLTEHGQGWLDAGFFAEYDFAMQPDEADAFTFGPILQKQFGQLLVTANIFAVADIAGENPEDPQLNYAFEAKYLLAAAFQPGFQLFGAPGAFTRFNRYSRQDNRSGPVLFGEISTVRGKIRYEAGYLVGLTHDSPSGTLKFQLEYEVDF
jgi:hypothetical protein